MRIIGPARGVCLLFVAVLVTGCAATIPKASRELDQQAKEFQPIPSKSAVYVVLGGGVGEGDFHVLLDGHPKGKITRRNYLLLTVNPGEHEVQVFGQFNKDHPVISLVTKADSCYFLHIDPSLLQPASIKQVDREKGTNLVRKASRILEHNILDKLGPPVQPVMELPTGKAVVYIYWPFEFMQTDFTIKDGKKNLAILKNGGCFAYIVDPGTVHLSAKLKAHFPFLIGLWGTSVWDVWSSSTPRLDLEVQSGAAHYVRCATGRAAPSILMPKLQGSDLGMAAVPEEEGDAQVRCCTSLRAMR